MRAPLIAMLSNTTGARVRCLHSLHSSPSNKPKPNYVDQKGDNSARGRTLLPHRHSASLGLVPS